MSAFARASEGGVQAVRAWRWVLPEEAARGALARELSGKGDALQLFDDVEAPALLAVAWATDPESRVSLFILPADPRRSGRPTPCVSPAGAPSGTLPPGAWSWCASP